MPNGNETNGSNGNKLNKNVEFKLVHIVLVLILGFIAVGGSSIGAVTWISNKIEKAELKAEQKYLLKVLYDADKNNLNNKLQNLVTVTKELKSVVGELKSEMAFQRGRTAKVK